MSVAGLGEKRAGLAKSVSPHHCPSPTTAAPTPPPLLLPPRVRAASSTHKMKPISQRAIIKPVYYSSCHSCFPACLYSRAGKVLAPSADGETYKQPATARCFRKQGRGRPEYSPAGDRSIGESLSANRSHDMHL